MEANGGLRGIRGRYFSSRGSPQQSPFSKILGMLPTSSLMISVTNPFPAQSCRLPNLNPAILIHNAIYNNNNSYHFGDADFMPGTVLGT